MNLKDISNLLLLWIGFNLVVAYDVDFNLDLKEHLTIFNKYRHPLGQHDSSRTAAREYIQRRFQEYDLKVHNQEFQTGIASYDNDITKVKGVNVIGESTVTSNGQVNPVVLIGANYDSSLQRNPLMENGAAMSVLLEIAKVFQDKKSKKKFIQNCTVLFVALDVNSKAYVPNGNGKSGSNHFAEDYLPKFLAGRKFLGAVILDSISNFNYEMNSQLFFEGFNEIFPDIYTKIRSAGAKGDFLAIITRGDDANMAMARLFVESFKFIGEAMAFRLQGLIIKDGMKITSKFANEVTKHSQAAFWKTPASFPALLLTDMDISRVPPDGDSCRLICDVDKFLSDGRKTFVEKTAKTIIWMLMSLQTNEPDQQKEITKAISRETTTEFPSCVSSICSNILVVKIAIISIIFLNYQN